MKKYRILGPILMSLILVVAAMEFRRTAEATIRSTIEEPIYTIAHNDYSAALLEGKHVVKLGPMFWGLYPGAIAFKTPEDAVAYMTRKEMKGKELAVYRLSGNYESDVSQEGEPHRINKSLMLVEKLNYE